MSTKQDYQIHLPELPVEIWCNILRYATEMPDTLEHPELTLDGFRGKLELTTNTVKRYQESIITKRNIVRVCRQWYALAIPYLFEHIMLFKPRGLRKLMETFESETTFIGTLGGSRKLGDLVGRIDILAAACPQVPSTTLLEMCRSTPNLVALTVPPLSGLNSLFSDEKVIPRLQYLHAMSAEGGIIRTKMPLKFLASRSSLRVYTPPWFESPTKEGPLDIWAPIQELIFPSFSPAPAFSYVTSFTKLPPGTFPNLHTVVFLRTESPLTFDCFLTAHGRFLRLIHIQVNRPNPCFLRRIFETLKKCCPVLQELLYSTGVAGFVAGDDDRPDSPMPGITTVAFQPDANQLPKFERQEFFDGILYWTPKLFPNARAIRLFSEAHIVHFQRCHYKAFDRFLESCGSLGIRVEDHFREPLNSPKLLTDQPVDTDSDPTTA